MGNAINSATRVIVTASAVFALPATPGDPGDPTGSSSDESESDKPDTDSGESSEGSPIDLHTTKNHASDSDHQHNDEFFTEYQKTTKPMRYDDRSQHSTTTLDEDTASGPPTAEYLPPRSHITFTHEVENGLYDKARIGPSVDRLSLEQPHSAFNQQQHEQQWHEYYGSPTDLSSRNLSTDARVCQKAKNKRKDRTTAKLKTGTEDDASFQEENMSSIVDRNGEKCQLEDLKKPKDDVVEKPKISSEKDNEIKNFILNFINQAGISEAGIVKFFDAAIVYDRKDYQAVELFMLDVKTIVEPRLHEQIRIELFDSMEFAQSKVQVVEDVIERCSVVFIYLTENCNQETFRLFCDEGIGITRLGISSEGSQWSREKQWVIKPVHTQPPKSRRYKTPIGLVSLQGIDWYDKDSAHTRAKLVNIMEHALQQRKLKERQVKSTHVDSRKLAEKIQRSSKPKSVREKTYKAQTEDFSSVYKHSFVDKESISEDAMSMERNLSFHDSLQNNQRGATQSIQNQQIPAPMHSAHGVMYSHQTSNQHQIPFAHPSNPHYLQANGQPYPLAPLGHFGSPYDNPAFAQQGIPTQIPPNYAQQSFPYAQQMYQPLQQPVFPQSSQAQFQNTYGYQPHPAGIAQAAPVVQSAGVYNPQFAYQTNNGHVNSAPIIPNQQAPRIYQSTSAPDQVPVNPTFPNASYPNAHFPNAPGQPNTPSVPGDYMRDRRNDAPPDSELSVVSRVDGRLIVNPNLSSDDIEIDEPSGRGETGVRSDSPEERRAPGPSSSKRNSRHNLMTENPRVTRQEDSSSSDDDSDIGISMLKGKGKKEKAVTIFGCKNIQLGSDNRVVENKEQRRKRRSRRKSSKEADTLGARGASMNSLKFSDSQKEPRHVDGRNTAAHSTRSRVYEDNLDLTLADTQFGHTAHATRNGTSDIGHQLHELKEEYVGHIDSDMYHRRQQRLSLTALPDASPERKPQPVMNCLDKADSTERQPLCRTELNVMASLSLNNVPLPETASDDQLFGEGNETLGESRSGISLTQNATPSVSSDNSESKIRNQEASFSFSKFLFSRQKPVSVPVQDEANCAGDQMVEHDELD